MESAPAQAALRKYNERKVQGPTNECSTCDGNFFAVSIKGVYTLTELRQDRQLSEELIRACRVFPGNRTQFCVSCHESVIVRKQLPKLCWAKVPLPTVHPVLKAVSRLEEQMVALRIPFMKIRTLGVDQQYGIQGNIVNVPIDINTSVNLLPRHFNQMHTIQVRLKRQMRHRSGYRFATISPRKVRDAAL